MIYLDVRISEEPRPGGVVGTFSGDLDAVNTKSFCRRYLRQHLRSARSSIPPFPDLDNFTFGVFQGTLDTFLYRFIGRAFHVLSYDDYLKLVGRIRL